VHGEVEVREPNRPYSGHVHPLYNIWCEVRTSSWSEFSTGWRQIEQRLKEEGKDLGDHWRELAEGLDVDYFALVAYSDGKLAGQVRFFPADVSRLRNIPEEYRSNRKDVLLIGAGCVDLPAADDRLDVEMVRRVVEYAKRTGYKAIRALGWSNIRAHAMWGESFPVSTYEALDFRTVARVSGGPGAINDMLAGSHGEEVQKQVTAAMDAGFTMETANELFVVELDLGGK
jgi:GNAT superfamily N-acetyltransferase